MGICDKHSLVEISQTQPYREGDGCWKSGKFTYWCKVCGAIQRYKYKAPYSDEMVMYEELKPTNL